MTTDEVLVLRQKVYALNLRGCDLLGKYTPEHLSKICNGIGAECLPEKLRKALDKLHPTLKVVAFLHDVAFYDGSGSFVDFTTANENFYLNGIIAANSAYKWYDLRRYIVRHQAKAFATICQAFGWKPYLDAVMQRRRTERGKKV